MKWWGVFCKKKWKIGEVFYVKKWTFPQRRVHYVQYQYFLFYKKNTPPISFPAYGPENRTDKTDTLRASPLSARISFSSDIVIPACAVIVLFVLSIYKTSK